MVKHFFFVKFAFFIAKETYGFTLFMFLVAALLRAELVFYPVDSTKLCSCS